MLPKYCTAPREVPELTWSKTLQNNFWNTLSALRILLILLDLPSYIAVGQHMFSGLMVIKTNVYGIIVVVAVEKVKQSLYRPRGFQEVEAPRFHDSQHMKVVSLSALCTGCLYPPGNIPGTHFF
jgi:hypothetical protein